MSWRWRPITSSWPTTVPRQVALPEVPLLCGVARHRRTDARGRQAQGAPRSRRLFLQPSRKAISRAKRAVQVAPRPTRSCRTGKPGGEGRRAAPRNSPPPRSATATERAYRSARSPAASTTMASAMALSAFDINRSGAHRHHFDFRRRKAKPAHRLSTANGSRKGHRFWPAAGWRARTR